MWLEGNAVCAGYDAPLFLNAVKKESNRLLVQELLEGREFQAVFIEKKDDLVERARAVFGDKLEIIDE